MHIQALRFALATVVISVLVGPTSAPVANPELEACRSTGLIALRERNPSIKDVSFDVDGMTLSEGKYESRGYAHENNLIGDAYLEKGKKDTRRTFLVSSVRKVKSSYVFHRQIVRRARS